MLVRFQPGAPKLKIYLVTCDHKPWYNFLIMDYTYGNLFSFSKQFLLPYKVKFISGSLFRFVSAILGLYSTYAFAEVVTFVTKYKAGDSLNVLYFILVSWTASFLIRYILIYWAKILCLNAGEQASLDIEVKALEHLSKLDISWHEKENVGNKVKRIQRGSNGVSTLVRVWVVNLIDIGVDFFGTFFIISKFDFNLAGLVVVYQIIYFLISTAFRRQAVIASKKKNIKDEEVTGLMFEVANNIRTVKVLGMAKPLLNAVKKINKDLLKYIQENLFWYHAQILARTSWQSIVRVILLGYVIYGIFKGQYEVGFLILFNGYFQGLSDSVNQLSGVAQDVALAKTDVARLAELFDEPICIEKEKGKVSFPSDWDGIHIRNLSFTYGHNAVLSSINFDIKRGEKVGIVGLSGAGKSTILKLLLKEYESQENDILIGDVPLRDIKKSDYIRHVAAVLQDTEVFNLSLRENIQFANISEIKNENLFERTIQISHVSDFLHKLPDGVESLVGEKGVKLSGGERQRLGIARAVFKSPEILFLDEATSHLDVESEQKIQDSLAHFFKDVTAVVIAHRLSTIKEMDRIIVIENGTIIETGTFTQLHKIDGRFREFWDKQRV